MSQVWRRFVPILALLAACSSSGSGPTPEVSPEPTPTPPDGGPPPAEAGAPADAGADADADAPPPDAGTDELDLRVDGPFARTAQPLPSGGWLVVYERPVHLKERWGQPLRTLAWLDAAGHERSVREATAGRELLDAAVHPSGEVTVVEASNQGFFLLRLHVDGSVRAETQLVDPAILTDPPAILPSESTSPIETVTHDVGRLATDGEDVFLATRTGRHSVIAYRLGVEGTTFVQRARTLVVPAHSIAPTALNGGSYDTFGQLDAHYGVFVAVDSARVGWVGTGHARLESGAFVRAHKKVFGEQLVTDPDYLDAYVSRIAASGERLGTTVVSTDDDEQLYGLRAIGDGAIALGRSEAWNAQGTGFDALVASIDHDGVPTVRTFDVDRGDIAFDVTRASDGGLLVAGASGYVQNPFGASLSEESHTFVRWLRADGSAVAVAGLPDGPRHSEARFVLPDAKGLVVGGMLDGPGTHSADGDASLLRARAFVKRIDAP